MTVFIDTGIFIALRNADDELHQRSKELMKKALKAEFGTIYTSDYIIDEAITTALIRTKRQDLATDIGKYIIESPRITKLWTTKETFELAWQKFQTLKDKPLSFTDCTTLAHIQKNKIKQILSFDSDFDGLAQRIH
ncbi:MAG: type II toxin-antitoxin system VapC family toxin [Candidatus Bathyarchaeia archaeon]|jgi:predicted nucleic acid-binding protein|nr:type II toxin-antitoxin system VapC family toxin [Candidatus Bathyarchaeota archaeon A05DMB-4]MDH7596076.1 PIN domain-containing protein [Candidatus Bathyarchaeota archaeon]